MSGTGTVIAGITTTIERSVWTVARSSLLARVFVRVFVRRTTGESAGFAVGHDRATLPDYSAQMPTPCLRAARSISA